MIKVWYCTQGILTTWELNKFLLATDNEGRMAWHLAVVRGELKKLQKVWNCAKEKLKAEDIK